MPTQKNLKSRSEPHGDTGFSRCCLKKSRFKKVLFCLAVAQAVGIFYLYRQNRETPTKKQEILPSAQAIQEPRNTLGSIFHLPLTHSKDMSRYYVEVKDNVWCLTAGTKSSKPKKGKCDCLNGWMGLDCGIPPAVWNSEFIAKGSAKGVQIKRRHHPRRIIYSVVYNGELELMNHTMSYLADIVEAFVIGEVSFTDTVRLSSEFQPQYSDKIVNISIGTYPTGSNVNYHKDIWMKGKKVMSDFRPDDIVVLTDPLSVPSKEVLMFFKLYEGFSEPIQFKLAATDTFHNTSLMSYFLPKGVSVSTDTVACTFEYLRYLCMYDASLVWSYDYISHKEESLLFEKNNWPLRQWTVGSTSFPAGFVCNFCFPVVNLTVTPQLESNSSAKVAMTPTTVSVLSNDTKIR